MSQIPGLGFDRPACGKIVKLSHKRFKPLCRPRIAPDGIKGRDCVVNIYEAGPFEGRLEQWPVLAVSGALEVRLAETEHEVEQAQRLRYSVFYEEMSAIPSPADARSGPRLRQV